MTIKVKNITLAILTVLLACIVAFTTVTLTKHASAEEAECKNTGIHIEGFDETTDSKVWNIHTDGAHTLTKDANYIKQGDGAFRTVGQGIADGTWQLAKVVDISEADAISFWLYLENADSFNNMADGQLALSDKDNVDNGKIFWELKGNNFVNGWQKVVFKMDNAKKHGAAVDLTKVSHMRIYFVGLAQITTAIFDDLHANFTEGKLLHGFNSGSTVTDQGSITTDVNYIKEGDGAFYTKGGGIAPGAFSLPATVDISKTDAISFKLYLENASTFNNMGDGQLALSDKEIENNGSIDGQKISYALKGRGFVDGWNTVIVKISDMAKEGKVDLTKICSYRIYFVGLSINGEDPSTYVTAVFDDLRAIETQFIPEDVEPIESYTVTDADNIISGVFDGMSLVYEGHKQGVASLSKNLNSGDNALNAALTLASGLTKSGDNELGLGFWLYVADSGKVESASVAISSSSTVGQFELNWTISSLKTGWNWIAVKASDATEKNIVEMNSLKRLTISLKVTDSIEVRLDRVRIFNTSEVSNWDAEPAASEAVVMDPVDSVSISNADTVSDTVFSGGVVEIKDHKEGSGAVKLSGAGLKTVSNLNVGKTDLLAADSTPLNEFGVTMWLYVPENFAYEKFLIAVGSSTFGVDGYTNEGRIAFNVNVSSLKTGWNWLVLKASNATEISLDFNANAINWFLIQAQGDKSSENTTYIVDRISAVNAAVASAIAEPAASEKIERNPVSGKIIINCDTTNGVTFAGNTVDTSDKREGKGSVRTEGAGFQLTAKTLNIGKTDLTKETLVLALWVYIEDPTVYDNKNFNGQFEISSSGTWDDKELNWEIGIGKQVDFSKMEAGWNWVVLKGSDANVSGGSINLDAIDYFRLYINNVSKTVCKLDRITLTNIDDASTYAEPDWESEIFGGGGDNNFQGANGNEALEGSPFLDIDVEGDPFDIIVTVTETTEGCGSNISYTQAFAAVMVLGGVLMLLFVKKKSKKQ